MKFFEVYIFKWKKQKLYCLKQFLILQYYRYQRGMFEDNFEPGSHINYNMEHFSTYRKRVSHFQIQNRPEKTQDNMQQNLQQDIAKNMLIDIDEIDGRVPLRLRDQNNIMNGWLGNKNEQGKTIKSFRTKVYSNNRNFTHKQVNSLRNSIEETENCIPKLKNILKKLQSPQRNTGFLNFKENTIYIDKKIPPLLEDNLSPPCKIDTAFHSITNRKTSRQKRKRIITFSDYKQSNKKPNPMDCIDDQERRMKNILIIKQAKRQQGLRR